MKRIYILFVTFGFLLNSCDDFLDKEPSTSLSTENAVTTLAELQKAINGIYFPHTGSLVYDDQTWVWGNYAGDFTIYADLLGGDFEPKGSYNQIAPVGRYGVDPSHKITESFYFIFYKTLSQINIILSVVDDIVDKDADPILYNNLKGQLYAMRALQHFDLARLYAKLPTTVSDMDKENSGIVLSDRVFVPSYKGKRATLQQTYDFILDDLKSALSLLPKYSEDSEEHIDLTKSKGYLTYWGAKSIQARAFLYLGKNEDALNAAKEVIEEGPYRLYTIEEYPQVWSQEATSESIFELSITPVYNAQRNSIGSYTASDKNNGYSECGLTDSFLTFLNERSNDVRSKLIQKQGDGNFYPRKYPGRAGQIYVNSPKIIRLSEVYLIAAEADIKENGESSEYGVKLVNELRKNRIINYADVNSVSIDDILTERRLELYTEGHNAWDYWRNKKSITNSSYGVVNYDNNKTILPLPQREISMNGDLVPNPL